MALKPWYNVVTPREDLREGRPLDASEFAAHLELIRDGKAPKDYTDPKTFFERTYMTKSLTDLASEVIRRLAGETTETNAIFNMATQFGGGKTHALTLLYHLAGNGSNANEWQGVQKLLLKANIASVPEAKTAILVGTEFDSIRGRGGDDGTPLRKTPWGEIAFQLGGEEGFAAVAKHDELGQAPGGDVIRDFLPDRPCLILMDELMNYITRHRKSGLSAQFYTFLQNLSEEARGRKGMVLAVSIPASELEMSAEDQSDHDRLKKLLDRLGKPIAMSTENETFEIIRRRLFEWDPNSVDATGKVMLSKEAIATCNAFGDWVEEHKDQMPQVFDTENARKAFAETYPFHPMTLSVFERKWQSLPRFQRTRGVLRMMALWVSRAYVDGFTGAHKDPLISMGTAPLNDPLFRDVVFEQLGEEKLKVAVDADISGKSDSHAIQLDKEASDSIKKSRLHQKVATVIFFESNGGQSRGETTLPEIHAAVAEPDLDIGNVITVLEELAANAYYLTVEGSKYRFGIAANLNKILSDKRAAIDGKDVESRVRQEVLDVFKKGSGIERVYFPERSNQITDRPILTIVVGDPSSQLNDQTKANIGQMITESGQSARTFKSALIWVVSDAASTLFSDAKKVLAWEAIEGDPTIRIEDSQKAQLRVNIEKARRDVKESVWRTYKHILLLDKDNSLRIIDLGLVNSSGYSSLSECIINRLKQEGDVQDSISPNFLVRNWSPVFDAWSVKSVRDAFFASPLFPKLLSGDSIKQTIINGVSGGQFAYVIKSGDSYDPFRFKEGLMASEVEIADDVYILKKELAEKYLEAKQAPAPIGRAEVNNSVPQETPVEDAGSSTKQDDGADEPPLFKQKVARIFWSGEISSQKWSLFYQKVLLKYHGQDLKVSVKFESAPDEGISMQKLEETKSALRELGLSDDVSTD